MTHDEDASLRQARATRLSRLCWMVVAMVLISVVVLVWLTDLSGRSPLTAAVTLGMSGAAAATTGLVTRGVARRPSRTDLGGPIDLTLLLVATVVLTGGVAVLLDPAPSPVARHLVVVGWAVVVAIATLVLSWRARRLLARRGSPGRPATP